VRDIAKFYSINETELFEMLGRVPLAAKEELEDCPTLSRLLSEIGTNSSLTKEDREVFYKKMHEQYQQLVDGVNR
jgi:hypothetical protein